VRTGGAGWEKRDVHRFESVLAVGLAQCRGAIEHEQPLLLGVLVVIRTYRLAGVKSRDVV
jgi:hypothetical protein